MLRVPLGLLGALQISFERPERIKNGCMAITATTRRSSAHSVSRQACESLRSAQILEYHLARG